MHPLWGETETADKTQYFEVRSSIIVWLAQASMTHTQVPVVSAYALRTYHSCVTCVMCFSGIFLSSVTIVTWVVLQFFASVNSFSWGLYLWCRATIFLSGNTLYQKKKNVITLGYSKGKEVYKTLATLYGYKAQTRIAKRGKAKSSNYTKTKTLVESFENLSKFLKIMKAKGADMS